MSFARDKLRRIDAQLDRVPLGGLAGGLGALEAPDEVSEGDGEGEVSARVRALQAGVRRLGAAEGGGEVVGLAEVEAVLGVLGREGKGSEEVEGGGGAAGDAVYAAELEWMLVAKATMQVYGHVLEGILASTARVAEELGWWDEVVAERRWTAWYGVQTSPVRVWGWGVGVWRDVCARRGEEGLDFWRMGDEARGSVRERWGEFYGLVRRVVGERSVREVHKQMLGPVTRVRNEVREKQRVLKQARLRSANALGILLGEGLANESAHGDGLATPTTRDVRHAWKASVARNVALMEAVLAKVHDAATPVDKFDAAIAELTEDDALYACEIVEHSLDPADALSVQPHAVAERLSRLLTLALPQYTTSTHTLLQTHGKPTRLIRYWLPTTLGLLSSSTILRILVHHRADLLTWIRSFGQTVSDFWSNWVLEPARKVLQTIRHDAGSEVSIMSRRSLEGDRESLERMTVQFAIDNPSDAPLSPDDIAAVRSAVREGDLTPVLKAYEHDLAAPFKGVVRGNLIRALLIQIQKTKVDVEVAMGGIDALLKSQELVFGFVGLTPGLLVSFFTLRWLRSSLSGKRGKRAERGQSMMLRQLRNVDRVLTEGVWTEEGELLYRDLGLLVAEVQVLRVAAEGVMPGRVWAELRVDVEELCDVRIGVVRQRRVAERIRWAYGRWLG